MDLASAYSDFNPHEAPQPRVIGHIRINSHSLHTTVDMCSEPIGTY